MKGYIKNLFVLLFLGVFAVNVYALENQAVSTKDAQIITQLEMLNKSEIMLSLKAIQNAQDHRVQEFARMMKHDHSKNLFDTKNLAKNLNIRSENSEKIVEMQKQLQNNMQQLKSLKGSQFDKAYMDLMVKEHVKAIEEIDNLLENVNNEQIKDHLKVTKEHIAKHLEQAQIIKNELS